MMSLVYSWFFYISSLFLFFNSSSFLMMWLNMEINLLTFMFVMSGFLNNSEKYGVILYYFLIQSLGSMLFLFSSFFKFGSYWFTDLFYTLSLTLKLGIFPLYFWMINLGGSLQPMILFLILTFQKIVIMIFLFTSGTYLLELVLISSFIYGSSSMFFCNSFSMILIISSISSCFWLYFFYLNGLVFYISYYFVYFIVLLSCYIEVSNFMLPSSGNLIPLFMFLGGLPPLFMFFLKFSASSFLYLNFGDSFCYLFLTFTFLGLFGYINYFQKTFFLLNFLYLNNKKRFSKMSKMSYSLMFFFYFLL